MARLLTSGVEWNDKTAEQTVVASTSASISSANPRSGTYHWRSASQSVRYDFAGGTLGVTYFARAYCSWNAFASPSGVDECLGLGDSGGYRVGFAVDETGLLKNSFTNTSLGVSISLNTYYRFEMSYTIGTGSVDAYELRFEGTSLGSGSGLALTDIVPATLIVASAAGSTIDADDIALNDSTGASQNSWPGSEKIVLLKPISNSAVGTGWTLGTGTAMGNGWDAVDNAPPVGVADLAAGSDTKQIRNASANANVSYDANLTSYTTAGLAAGATVNVLVPIVCTAAPVTTSAKAGTFGVSANPVIANVALGAGGTPGAFWSGAGAGTYPTGWKWSFGTTTYAPTVTLASSPVARITQVTSSTRIAMVAAMGMYVGYTPATTKAPPVQARTQRNFLLRR